MSNNIVNLNQISLYGFIQQWGYNAFGNAINVGAWQGQNGRYAQNYTYQASSSKPQAYSATTYPYSQIGFPSYESFPGSSTLVADAQQGNISVSALQWEQGANGGAPYTISGNYTPYYNLYTLLSPLSGSSSGPITVINPAYYFEIPASGGSYQGVNQSYVSYGSPSFTVASSVDDAAITYAPTGKTPLTISNGQITYSALSLAEGKSLNIGFTFIPGATPVFEVSSQFTQAISSNNTQGTSQSGSDSGSNTATFGITDTETATVGIDESNNISASLQQSYSDAWQSAWSNTSAANFSTTNAISSTSEFGFSLTENLNNAIVTGEQTTANGNKTPLYSYTTTYTDPSTGQLTTTSFDLIAGGEYEWNLQYYQGHVNNVVSGQYTLSGNAGYIEDSIGNSFGGTSAQAFFWANNGSAWDTLGYGYNPIASFNSETPDEMTEVYINGSTTTTTSESVNLDLSLSAISSVSSGAPSSSSSALLKQPTERRNQDTLLHGNKKWINIVDGLLVRPEKTLNSSSYYGDNSSSYVRDTLGQDLIRTSGGNDFVLVRGNRVQSSNNGDIVNLGSGDDVADARKALGSNSVNAGTGNDLVLDGVTDLMTDLGDGNDRYIYGGGSDYLRLGLGRDTIDSKHGHGSIIVDDFNAGQDIITGLDKKSKLVWDDRLSAFTINRSDRVTGTLYTNDSLSTQDPEFWYGLGLQNSQRLRLNATQSTLNSWQKIRTSYGVHGFDQANLKTKAWEDFLISRNDVDRAARYIASCSGITDLSKKDFTQINQIANVSDSFYGFIAATTSYVTQP